MHIRPLVLRLILALSVRLFQLVPILFASLFLLDILYPRTTTFLCYFTSSNCENADTVGNSQVRPELTVPDHRVICHRPACSPVCYLVLLARSISSRYFLFDTNTLPSDCTQLAPLPRLGSMEKIHCVLHSAIATLIIDDRVTLFLPFEPSAGEA